MSNRTWMILALVSTSACSEGIGVDLDGRYEVRSTFHTPRGIPELDAPAFAALGDLAAQPDRVEGWLLDRLSAELDGPYRTALDAIRSGTDLEAELHKYLSLVAPDYQDALVELARETTRLTQTVRLNSELELVGDGDGTGSATHTFTGMWFEVAGREERIDFIEVGVEAPVAHTSFDTYLTKDAQVIRLGQHRVQLAYGELLGYLMDEVVVRSADPFSDSLGELISRTVPCRDIGELIATFVDAGPGEVYGVACASAFGELSERVLPGTLEPVQLTLLADGDALVLEGDDLDARADGFELGEWSGSLGYPSSTVTLRGTEHSFEARRHPSPR